MAVHIQDMIGKEIREFPTQVSYTTSDYLVFQRVSTDGQFGDTYKFAITTLLNPYLLKDFSAYTPLAPLDFTDRLVLNRTQVPRTGTLLDVQNAVLNLEHASFNVKHTTDNFDFFYVYDSNSPNYKTKISFGSLLNTIYQQIPKPQIKIQLLNDVTGDSGPYVELKASHLFMIPVTYVATVHSPFLLRLFAPYNAASFIAGSDILAINKTLAGQPTALRATVEQLTRYIIDLTFPIGNRGQVYKVDQEQTNSLMVRNSCYIGAYALGQSELVRELDNTPTQKELFDFWTPFVIHEDSAYPFDSQADWSYDKTLDETRYRIASENFAGKLSTETVDDYELEVIVSSENPENQAVGIVLGSYVNAFGNINTLSVLRSPGGFVPIWCVVENAGTSTQTIHAQSTDGVDWGNGKFGSTEEQAAYDEDGRPGWTYEETVRGYKIYIKKTNHLIVVKTSLLTPLANIESSDYIDTAQLSVDLSTNPQLSRYEKNIKIGICTFGQPQSHWDFQKLYYNTTVYDLSNGRIYQRQDDEWTWNNGLWNLVTRGDFALNRRTSQGYYIETEQRVHSISKLSEISINNPFLLKDLSGYPSDDPLLSDIIFFNRDDISHTTSINALYLALPKPSIRLTLEGDILADTGTEYITLLPETTIVFSTSFKTNWDRLFAKYRVDSDDQRTALRLVSDYTQSCRIEFTDATEKVYGTLGYRAADLFYPNKELFVENRDSNTIDRTFIALGNTEVAGASKITLTAKDGIDTRLTADQDDWYSVLLLSNKNTASFTSYLVTKDYVDRTLVDTAMILQTQVTDLTQLVTDRLKIGQAGQVYRIAENETNKTKVRNQCYTGIFTFSQQELDMEMNTVPSQEDMFNEWSTFSIITSNPGNSGIPNELLHWEYDPDLDAIKNTSNSSSLIGRISRDRITDYEMEVLVYSTHSDDDMIGLVLGVYELPNGHYQVLSALRSPGGVVPIWSVFFNFRSSNQQMVAQNFNGLKWGNGKYGSTRTQAEFTENTGHGWRANNVTRGCKIYAKKTGSIIELKTSDIDDYQSALPYVESANITVDLNSNSNLIPFIANTRIGICGYSQPHSFWNFLQLNFLNDDIYDLQHGRIFGKKNDGWQLKTESVWNVYGAGDICINKRTGRTYYIAGQSSVFRMTPA